MTSVVASLADPGSASVMLASTSWVQNMLLGTLATIIAIIAIASIGFAMLLGRIEMRRGFTVLMGCFILFGASAIANGLRSATSSVVTTYGVGVPPTPLVTPQYSAADQNANPFDPYAGASVQR